MTIDEAQMAELRQICSRLLSRTEAVYTTEEAIAYTKLGSLPAFYRWAKKWKVSRLSNGRYAREHLEAALRREASQRLIRTRRTLPRSTADNAQPHAA